MFLNNEQMRTYDDQGYLFFPEYLKQDEVDAMRAEVPSIFSEETPRRILEKNSNIVRSVYCSHTTNQVFQRLSRHSWLVKPAMQILGSEIYIHQFKINAKAAFEGDIWEWHRDYIYWHNEDGMMADRAINVVIFLDDVNEFNGPLILIPGSHKENPFASSDLDESTAYTAEKIMSKLSDGTSQENSAWMSTVTAKLKYTIDKESLAKWVAHNGMIAPKGLSGSVLLFHPNLIHGSAPNMSPFDRMLVIISYNSTKNILQTVKKPRPEFLASRDYTPVIPL